MLGVTETTSWGVLYYAFTVFVAPMEAELGWSRAAMTGAFSIALLVLGVSAVPIGRWLDHHGPRALMTAGSCAAVALVVAWSMVRDLATFYAIWILIGVTMASVLYGPAFATVAVWFRRLRSRALTVLTLMAGLASTIFIPLAAWLVATQGWRNALVSLAVILGVLTIAPHALLLRRRPSDLGLLPDGGTLAAEAVPPQPEQHASLREALRHPSFPWLVLAFCLSGLTIGLPVHLVPYLAGRGFDLAFAAGAAGSIGVMQLVGRIVFAPLERLIPLRAVSVGVFVVMGLALVSLAVVPSVVGVVLFVALFGASRGAETLLRLTIVAGLYGSRRFASISGVLTLFITVVQSAAPVSIGLAFDLSGGYEVALWALAIAAFAAGAAIYRADRRP
ncbi:MAG TPA: MFS transporter [Candidatus Limnocylindria bacterium]